MLHNFSVKFSLDCSMSLFESKRRFSTGKFSGSPSCSLHIITMFIGTALLPSQSLLACHSSLSIINKRFFSNIFIFLFFKVLLKNLLSNMKTYKILLRKSLSLIQVSAGRRGSYTDFSAVFLEYGIY